MGSALELLKTEVGAHARERHTSGMADPEQVNILIVDDLPEKLLALDSVLAEPKQNVLTALSGQEALRLVLQHDFAVILLDVNMPTMDGFETAALIRARRRSSHTPIIFVTAFADEDFVRRGYALGAVDFVLSPIVPEVLRTKVKVFAELFRKSQQLRQQADERVALAKEQAARAAAEEATRRSTFLAEAGMVLASSLELDVTLRNLARLAVPFLADLAIGTRANMTGDLGRVELAWKDGKDQIHFDSLDTESLAPSWSAAIRQALLTGRVEQMTDLPWPTAEERETAPGLVCHTALVLPLAARGHMLGALALGVGVSRGRFSAFDISVADDLAGRAGIALDNARLYQNIQESDRRKNEFLAMLAHELRNPLAPLSNVAQVMRLIDTTDARLNQARDMIERQVGHMARLIDDLLDVSRLSRGKILLRKQDMDLAALVRETAEDYRSTLEQRGLTLEVQCPETPLHVDGDPTRLAQVLGNVLHNANKFTDRGGRIHVAVATNDSNALITIRDTGIGMDAEMLSRVFETFSQADRSLHRSLGGLGLGLALVKGLVELHGGDVQAASAGPGTGTEVTIRLPLSPSLTAARQEEESALPADRARRILVIEDSHDSAESMRMLLSLSGHQVHVAFDGKAGVEAARQLHPEMIICDIGLPGLDGYGVARSLRQDPAFTQTVLIALTGYGREEDQRSSREAGFDAHLIKPVNFEALRKLLRMQCSDNAR